MINIYDDRFKKYFILFLFLITFLFRLPTLFNDYYDVDELAAIVQTWHWQAGDIPGKEFAESKLPVYHSIFKLSYSISEENGWILVHLFTILIIFFTCCFIYKIGSFIKDRKTGIISALLYGILISSFNRQFMATNGEIIYNLPVAAGAFFFIRFLSEQKKGNLWSKVFFLFMFTLSLVTASQVKFHGIILLLAVLFFYCIYLPFSNKLISKKIVFYALSFFSLMILVIFIDNSYSKIFAPKIIKSVSDKLFYAIFERGLNPLVILGKFIHRQYNLILWHSIAWIPAYIYVYKLIRNKKLKEKTLETQFMVIMFLSTFFMVFGGGARLYFHYFMASYPFLVIMSALGMDELTNRLSLHMKKNFLKYLLIPSLILLTWNLKDIAIKYYSPRSFTEENRVIYWTRAVLLGTWNNYLLPDKNYSEVCNYIKENSQKSDRVSVWGNGPYINYFSRRKTGSYDMWPKNRILRIRKAYKSSDNARAISIEKGYIKSLIRNKPLYFVDVSQNGMAGFNFKLTPLVKEYIDQRYKFEKDINRIKIYRRR